MRQLTVGILAPAIMAAGAMSAVAQGAPFYDSSALDYSMNALFLSRPPTVISVGGLPTPALVDLEPMLRGATGTDGAGKILGVQYARVYFGGASNRSNNYATFVVNITGTINTKGSAPVVKMTLKGHGYDFDAQSDHPDASLTLTFTSTNRPTAVAPNQAVVVDSANYTVTYLNGSPVLLTTNVPTPYSGYYVNPTNYAVTFLFTNGPATMINNSRYSAVGGMLKGTISPGKKSTANGGKQLKINQAAALFTESLVWTVVDDTNFVQQAVGGSLVVNLLSNITAQVVQPVPGSKLYMAGGVGSTLDPYSGTGTVNNKKGTFKLKLQGVSSARGASLNVTGTLGPVIAAYQPTTNANFPTGYITNWLYNAIKQLTFSGKAVGQNIPSTTGVNPNAPFPPAP